MNIAFYLADQNPHRDRTLGITTYTDGLIRELLARREMEISLLRSSSSYRPEGKVFAEKLIPFRTDHAPGRLLADQFHPLWAKVPCDIWHYPKGFLSAFFRSAKPVVGTIHDVILQHYADVYPSERSRAAYAFWLANLKRSISRFDAILTVSEFSAKAIHEFCERHGLKCPPVMVTYQGCQWPCEEANVGPKDEMVVHLASDQPHKQTSRLIDFWKKLEAEKKWDIRLALVGPLGAEVQRTVNTLKFASTQTRIFGQELKNRIGKARALIIPSEIEGFGLPAIEGYAAGTPVVYVKNTVVEEILGQGTPGGFFLNSFDSFTAALDEVLAMTPEEIRTKAMELSSRFSWPLCAGKTIAAYKSVLGSH